MNQLRAINAAIVAGDLDGLRSAYGDPDDFPNTRDECGRSCLDHAIYDGPIALIRALLDLGADPNYRDSGGDTALFAAIERAAPDYHEVLALLLATGANVQLRGINDYTALHLAACRDDAVSVELLLRHGADPDARTRIDDYATPLEEAELRGYAVGAAALRKWTAVRRPPHSQP
jgi:ankyrin repeat protein